MRLLYGNIFLDLLMAKRSYDSIMNEFDVYEIHPKIILMYSTLKTSIFKKT